MRLFGILCLILSLVSCDRAKEDVIKVGTIAGPETELIEVAKDVAAQQYNLNVKIIEFSDYNLPNEALHDGSLDMNVYQHLPYLKSAIKAKRYNLEVIGRTFVYPTGLYSKKIKKIDDLPDNALLAIPNDPSNEARALQLLAKANLITLKETSSPTTDDIIENPKKLRFKELDAAQLPRVLEDVDGAIINTTFALPAGLHPSEEAILLEGSDSPYANLIVIHQNSPKKEQLKQFVKAIQSNQVKEKAKQLFGKDAIPAWD